MKATILCYHKVGPLSQEGKRLNVTPENLKSHVRFFTRRQTRILLAKDFISCPTENAIAFTFDDAYSSTLENAPSVLESAGVRGSFYAVSQKVGKTSDWDAPEDRPLADWTLLKEASMRGHEIGNHSATHRRLGQLPLEEQKAEVSACHAELLANGIIPTSICYPYGSFNADTLHAARESGYLVGLSLKKGNLGPVDRPLELPRVVVGFSDGLPMLLYKIVLRPKMRRIGL